ncbi:cation:proton antiporter [Pontibacter sp. H249]|uniref:cation:proton antiporter n=1 Tax=Pontibacter sp. H249 TaxID=3133420 RepID=UPI0030BB7D03
MHNDGCRRSKLSCNCNRRRCTCTRTFLQIFRKESGPPTLLALIIGILLGPEVLHVFDPARLGNKTMVLENAARLTLGIGLVSVALRIPKHYPQQNWRQMLTLIGAGMLLMWGISSLLIYLILGIPFWLAALIGAIITPTDPIAASPIVTGEVAERNLPERIRNAISFESGANDGLSYLFVFLPFLMLTMSQESALSDWLLHTLLWEVVAATGFGLLLGYVAAKLLKWSENKKFIQEEWRLMYSVALALVAVGVGKLIHSDEVLLVFAAGATFDQIASSDERREEEKGQEAVNRFFSIPIFTLLGAAIPWGGWDALGWSGILLVVAILVLRRLPVIFILKPFIPAVHHVKDVLYLGWFGPIAVAAIYYAAMMEHRLKDPFVWDVVSLIICASVVAHGTSATPLTQHYGAATSKKYPLEDKPAAKAAGNS